MLNQRQSVIAKVHVVTVDEHSGRAIAAALNKFICIYPQSILVFLIVDGAQESLLLLLLRLGARFLLDAQLLLTADDQRRQYCSGK